MQKICLINPGYDLEDTKANRLYIDSGYNTPSLGLGYLASYLEKNGFYIDIIECMMEDIGYNRLIDIVNKNKYNIVGLSICDQTRKHAFKIVKLLEKNFPTLNVIVGGYAPTLSYESILKTLPFVKCCILGEGEETFLEIVRKLDSNQEIDMVEGIAYLKNNNVKKNNKRDLIQNLDKLPFPKRKVINERKVLNIISSRGCINSCTYCSISAFYKSCKGEKFRYRSAENVINEIYHYIAKYGRPDKITFYDDNFLSNEKLNLQNIEKLCPILKEINIPFCITTRAQDIVINYKLVEELKKAGLCHLFVGIETFSQRQLDLYNKNTTTEVNLKALSILDKLDITVEIGFIPFDVSTTLEEIQYNFEILKNSKYKNIIYKTGKIFSENCYVMAVNGTQYRNLLIKENKYFNNNRGYIFDEYKVEYLFLCLSKWNDILSEIKSKMYMVFEVNKYNNIYNEIYELNKSLTILDIDFVIELCKSIRNNKEFLYCYNLFKVKIENIKYKYLYLENKINENGYE